MNKEDGNVGRQEYSVLSFFHAIIKFTGQNDDGIRLIVEGRG